MRAHRSESWRPGTAVYQRWTQPFHVCVLVGCNAGAMWRCVAVVSPHDKNYFRPARIFFGHLLLGRFERDVFRPVVRDCIAASKAVKNRFAATCKVVGIEESAAIAFNADVNASWASSLIRFLPQWPQPSIAFRLGVTYPGIHSSSPWPGTIVRLGVAEFLQVIFSHTSRFFRGSCADSCRDRRLRTACPACRLRARNTAR